VRADGWKTKPVLSADTLTASMRQFPGFVAHAVSIVSTTAAKQHGKFIAQLFAW
jgi:hypothetical protein